MTDTESRPLQEHPVKVEVVGSETIAAADFGSWDSVVLGGTEQPFQFLPQAPLRDRAVILVQGTAGANVGIRVGTQEQVQNGRGAVLLAPCTITKESQPEVWMAPLGAAVTVAWLDERYR